MFVLYVYILCTPSYYILMHSLRKLHISALVLNQLKIDQFEHWTIRWFSSGSMSLQCKGFVCGPTHVPVWGIQTSHHSMRQQREIDAQPGWPRLCQLAAGSRRSHAWRGESGIPHCALVAAIYIDGATAAGRFLLSLMIVVVAVLPVHTVAHWHRCETVQPGAT